MLFPICVLQPVWWLNVDCGLCFPVQQKSMEDLHSRMKRIYSKAVEDDEAAKQKLQEAWEGFLSKAKGTIN